MRALLTRFPAFIAFVLGVLSVLCFAPFSLGWGLPLILAALFGLWQQATPRQAAWRGTCFGLGLFLAGVYWLNISLTVYGGMPLPLALVGTSLFALYLSIFPALAAYVSTRWMTSPYYRALLAGCVWPLTEVLRGTLLTGFPWLVSGYSQVDTPLAGLIPVGGVYAASWGASLTAALITLGVQMPAHRKRACFAVLVLWLGAAGLRQVVWTQPVGKPLRISLLQGNIAQDVKWDPAHAMLSYQTYAAQIAAAPGQLIVTPETALPHVWPQIPPDFLADTAATLRQKNAALLLGVVEYDGHQFANSAVLLGTPTPQWYRKAHLVPFGEYLPLRSAFAWVLDILHIPLGDMSRGAENQAAITYGGQRILMNICYEDVFGEDLKSRIPNSTLLMNISNLAWFGDTIALDQHLQIGRVRALEAGRPALTATNTGVTAVIDAQGAVLARLPTFKTATLSYTVDGHTGLTPFARFGHRWLVLIGLAIIGLSFSHRKARLRHN